MLENVGASTSFESIPGSCNVVRFLGSVTNVLTEALTPKPEKELHWKVQVITGLRISYAASKRAACRIGLRVAALYKLLVILLLKGAGDFRKQLTTGGLSPLSWVITDFGPYL